MSSNFYLDFGDKWRKLNQLPTIEHHLFFQYLLVSPSYYQASLARKNQSKGVHTSKDFNQVLKVYDLVGNIYETPFEVWWEACGCDLFYSGTRNPNLVLNLDLANSKDELLIQVIRKIDDALERYQKSSPPQLELLVNKLHTYSLFEKMRVLTVKASTYEEGEDKLKNWQIAIMANMESKLTKGLAPDSKQTHKNQHARDYLSMFVSKNLSDALLVSENAARGLFPSKERNDSSLSFDYQLLSRLLDRHEIMEIKFLQDMAFSDKELKFRSYWEIMNKKLKAKRRARKKLDIEVAKEIERRSKEDLY
jgi:hypothetical protein